MKAAFVLGRLIFGGFFLYNGIHHFQERKSMAQYVESKNIAMPDLAVTATGVALTIGGASIVLGVKPKLGTAAIAGFLLAVSPAVHDFWNHEDTEQRTNEMINFTKNMALLGGALALMGVEEPWPASAPVAQPSRVERLRRFGRRLIAA